MQLKAYWVGNFIMDFIKMYLTIAITLILFEAFDFGMKTAWITYLVFPIGALPFTYMTSFLFSADSAAQTFTMFFHFLTICILSTVAFALRLAPEQQANGDKMNFAMKAIPTYSLASSVYCDASCATLADLRERIPDGTGEPLSADVWHISNNLIDVLMPIPHLLFWGLVLVLIEKGWFGWIRRRPNKKISEAAQKLDDDV